jgi:hypothetical protein
MLASSLFHAALSAAAVGALLSALQRAGPRVAGLAAAVPINSVPALFWLFIEYGGRFATTAVLGSLYGTALTVVLGASFARLALAGSVARAALLAWLAIAAVTALTWGLTALPAGIALVALGAIALGRLALPALPVRATERQSGSAPRAWPPIVVAGAMSFAVSELSRHAGARFCGLFAALPLMATFALHAGYRRGGAPLMLRVLRGYLDGMTAKAAFLGTLACAWALGVGAWAWAFALAAAGVALMAHGASARHVSASTALRTFRADRAGQRGEPHPS